MTYLRLDLMRAERDAALDRVRELVEEVAWLRAEYAALERVNLDLVEELAETRRRLAAAREELTRDL